MRLAQLGATIGELGDAIGHLGSANAGRSTPQAIAILHGAVLVSRAAPAHWSMPVRAQMGA